MNTLTRILWTSPHCRPDWIERLGEESQGGQTEVMLKQPRVLVEQNPDLSIDIYTRYQANDFQVVNSEPGFIGEELYHDPDNGIHVKALRDGRIRIIRLPAGPVGRYIPKEILYGEYIDEFVGGIVAFSKGNGVTYQLAHGHYADGWETVTKLSKHLAEAGIDLPTVLTTYSLGRRKRADCLARGEGTEGELDEKYNFPVRIASEEESLRYAERICPLSTTEKEFLEEQYQAVKENDPRLVATPNGITPGDFKHAGEDAVEELERTLGIKDKLALLVPSRVDPRKGQLNLVKAFDVLGNDFLEKNNLCALFIAWPKEETVYSRTIESYVQDNKLDQFVIKKPPIPHEKMPTFFDAAELVVIPSQEYFSIAMIEAMLLEKPLIASKEGGSGDAIIDGDSGYLVDHNDPRQIAAAIKKIVSMSENERKELGTAARQRILNNYTLDKVAERISNIYCELG